MPFLPFSGLAVCGHTMRLLYSRHVAALAVLSSLAAPASVAGELPAPAPLSDPATTVYRQLGRDGTVIYSDRPLGNVALDAMLTIEPPIPGSGWTTRPGKGADVPPQTMPTAVRRNTTGAEANRPRTLEEADTRVIQTEMLLEEARNRLVLSHPGGEPPLASSAVPAMRDDLEQQTLRRQVEEAEQAWIEAVRARNGLRGTGSAPRQAALPRNPDAETVSRGYERIHD